METGFNSVEVPGSKSRKVAGKKQQWYRTAILKKFSLLCNLPDITYFYYNFLLNHSFLQCLLRVVSRVGRNLEANPNFQTISEMKFVFFSKLQKTALIIFSGFTDVLVKSNYSSIYNKEFGLINTAVTAGQGSDTLKKQIKWLSI